VDKVKQLGQYFTPDFVADFMVGLATTPQAGHVLEPSSGHGVFLESLIKAGYKYAVGYELDKTLSQPTNVSVRHESFISATFDQKFDLVIGNPPYVRWKNMATAQKDELSQDRLWNRYFNSLSDYLYIFILKSIELLNDGGELIFITPEYWLNTMHSQRLRDYMVAHGSISEIYHFNETPIFTKVASSIIIFKFVKAKSQKPITIHRYSSKKRLQAADLQNISDNPAWNSFTTPQFQLGKNWVLAPAHITDELLAYEAKCQTGSANFHNPTLLPDVEVPYVQLGDIADIANGLVSGLDKAFQLPVHAELNQKEEQAVLHVVKAKDMQSFVSNLTRKYIYLNETPLTEAELKRDYPTFYKHLQPYKADLKARYDYNKPLDYWDWVFLRSLKLFKQDRLKIFVPCKERITNKTHLRFCLAQSNQFPTQDMAAIYLTADLREDTHYILALLNSKVTYDWVKYKGLVKGGVAEFSERPLSSVPIRLIDWAKPNEVALHTEIVSTVKAYMAGANDFEKIDQLVLQLLK